MKKPKFTRVQEDFTPTDEELRNDKYGYCKRPILEWSAKSRIARHYNMAIDNQEKLFDYLMWKQSVITALAATSTVIAVAALLIILFR